MISGMVDESLGPCGKRRAAVGNKHVHIPEKSLLYQSVDFRVDGHFG
jgi:hypothetical protein